MDLLSGIKGFLDFAISISDKVPVIRAVIGTLLVFIVPGFAWTLIFFKKDLQPIERMVLSFGLSIAMVTLSILFTNIVLHIRITGLNSLLTIIVITLIPLSIYYIQRHLTRKNE